MSNTYIVTKVFLAVLILKGLIESWLEHKNKNHILTHSSAVPDKFKDSITLEEHQKAATYSATKIRVGQFFNIINVLVLLGWTIFGGLSFLNDYVATLGQGPIVTGVIFFGIFTVISSLIGLPQSIYSTFVIEERFGFNKTTPKLFFVDLFKGLALGIVIGLPILAAILWIMTALGKSWWLWAFAFLTAFQFILIWAYPRFIAPLFNKFSPLDEGETKNKVEGLLQRTGFTSNGLFVMDASVRSSHGNAYFTGFGKNKRIVFFDTLIKTLDPEEVEAVLAHELGHFKRKHIVKGMARSIFFSFIGFAVLGQLINWAPFFKGHGVENPSLHAALLLFAIVSGIYTFFLTPLGAKISRKYEFEADEFAAKYAKATSLITALVKLYKENASTLTPDPTYSAWYHSHPPALIRVNHLESLKSN